MKGKEKHLAYHFEASTGEALVPLQFAEYGPYSSIDSYVKITRTGPALNLEIQRRTGNLHVRLDEHQATALSHALLQCVQKLDQDLRKEEDNVG
jgi:hypothetical protein